MANSCRAGEGDHKRSLALRARANDPELSYSEIAMRVGVTKRTVERWLGPAARVQSAAVEPQPFGGPCDEEAWDTRGVDDFLDADSTTARPRNLAVRALCPESL